MDCRPFALFFNLDLTAGFLDERIFGVMAIELDRIDVRLLVELALFTYERDFVRPAQGVSVSSGVSPWTHPCHAPTV
jgi:hypothetical protein